MARIFFIHDEELRGNFVHFSDRTQRHLQTLRKRSGDTIQAVTINPNTKALVTIQLVEHNHIYSGEVIQKDELILPDQVKIHILQCIPRLDKMELIIQKCSELGAYAITPLFSNFSDIRDKIGEKKLTRWQYIAEESSIQSGRKDIILVSPPENLTSYLQNLPIQSQEQTVGIILNELEKDTRIEDIKDLIASPDTKEIFVLIGAEGGFAKEEIDLAKSKSFASISIGERIVRTETAPIAITAIIQYIRGEI